MLVPHVFTFAGRQKHESSSGCCAAGRPAHSVALQVWCFCCHWPPLTTTTTSYTRLQTLCAQGGSMQTNMCWARSLQALIEVQWRKIQVSNILAGYHRLAQTLTNVGKVQRLKKPRRISVILRSYGLSVVRLIPFFKQPPHTEKPCSKFI